MAAARNPGKAFTEFAEQDLSVNGTNKFDIYCPQETCRCKLLRASAATLVQREKSKLVLPSLPVLGAAVSTINDTPAAATSKSPSDEKTASEKEDTAALANGENLQPFWKVTDMMAFENIGFSKKLPTGIQFLSCADCDIGPLGYHEAQSPATNKEFLVALNRVRYHEHL